MTAQTVDQLGPTPLSANLLATLARANNYARSQSHASVTLEHVLLALSEDPDAAELLTATNVDISALKADVSGHISRSEDRVSGEPADVLPLSAEVGDIMKAASAAARDRRPEINGAIVLAAIVGDGRSTAAHTLRAQGLTFEHAIQFLRDNAAKAPAPSPQPAPPVEAPATTANANPQDHDIFAGARTNVDARTQSRNEKKANDAVNAEIRNAEPSAPPAFSESESAEEEDDLARRGDAPATSVPPHSPPQPRQSDVRAGKPAPPSLSEQLRRQSNRPSSAGADGSTPGAMPPPHQPSVESAHAPQASAPDPRAAPPPPIRQPAPQQQPQDVQRRAPPEPSLPPIDEVLTRRVQQSPAPPLPPSGYGQQSAPAPQMGANRRGPVVGQAPAGGPPPVVGGGQPQAHSAPSSRPPQAGPPGGVAQRANPASRTIEAGQLVENIPRVMTVGVPMLVEARIAKGGVRVITHTMQGPGQPQRHEILVSKAMSVRLRASTQAFTVETASPETQWIENNLGSLGDDFASWRWTITPKTRGKKQLQLIVSARTVGGDGLAAETVLPDQVIAVKVRTNFARTARKWGGWIAAAIVGGLFARFGETFFDLGSMLIEKIASG